MIMDDRGVSPGRGPNALARLREESAQDGGVDLSATNVHGERVPIAEVYEPVDASVRSVSASDDGAPEGARESEGAPFHNLHNMHQRAGEARVEPRHSYKMRCQRIDDITKTYIRLSTVAGRSHIKVPSRRT